jgi:hypothetical protein
MCREYRTIWSDAGAGGGPEIDRTRGFLALEKNADLHGSTFVRYVLGGPGRNRTTDTRIFNPRVAGNLSSESIL